MLDPSIKTRKLVVKNIGNEQCGVNPNFDFRDE